MKTIQRKKKLINTLTWPTIPQVVNANYLWITFHNFLYTHYYGLNCVLPKFILNFKEVMNVK